jgi:hypothetical protein
MPEAPNLKEIDVDDELEDIYQLFLGWSKPQLI